MTRAQGRQTEGTTPSFLSGMSVEGGESIWKPGGTYADNPPVCRNRTNDRFRTLC